MCSLIFHSSQNSALVAVVTGIEFAFSLDECYTDGPFIRLPFSSGLLFIGCLSMQAFALKSCVVFQQLKWKSDLCHSSTQFSRAIRLFFLTLFLSVVTGPLAGFRMILQFLYDSASLVFWYARRPRDKAERKEGKYDNNWTCCINFGVRCIRWTLGV
jgi:hypothetical protein